MLAGDEGEALKHLVADIVAEAVVDRLEMIDVEDGDAGARRALPIAQDGRSVAEGPRLGSPVNGSVKAARASLSSLSLRSLTSRIMLITPRLPSASTSARQWLSNQPQLPSLRLARYSNRISPFPPLSAKA
jgi:hypothetical protein